MWALFALYPTEAKTSSADDYLYAPIAQAYFRKDGARNLVYLSGAFTNSCMEMVEAKVMTQKKVIVVQPIAKMNTSTLCKSGNFPFELSAEVKDVTPGRYLLHVRALNGKSVNNLVDIL